MLARRLDLTFASSMRFHSEIASWGRDTGKVLLAKPQMFMNRSGEPVAAISHYYRIPAQRIYIVYDDLDLPMLKLRIKSGGGHGGHNGIKSINQHLNFTDYMRIKVGIGRPDHGEVTPWVLGDQSPEERDAEDRVFSCLFKHLGLILEGNTSLAANRIHLCIQTTSEQVKAKRTH